MLTLSLDNLHCPECWHKPAVGRSTHHGLFPLLSCWITEKMKRPSPSQRTNQQNNCQLERKTLSQSSQSCPGTFKHLGMNINPLRKYRGAAPVASHQKHFQTTYTQHSSVLLSSWVVLFCSHQGAVLPVEDESHVQPQHNSHSSVSERPPNRKKSSYTHIAQIKMLFIHVVSVGTPSSSSHSGIQRPTTIKCAFFNVVFGPYSHSYAYFIAYQTSCQRRNNGQWPHTASRW